MSYNLYEKFILTSSLIGATIGTGIGINISRNFNFPDIRDIVVYPFVGLSIGTAVGIFFGCIPISFIIIAKRSFRKYFN
jgi:hypothetical protein